MKKVSWARILLLGLLGLVVYLLAAFGPLENYGGAFFRSFGLTFAILGIALACMRLLTNKKKD
ncbi:MAG: hypothetical protein MJZ01_01855 [Bacteroidales bacterium]|nr:hypothetical protein [Bacteroidales bacterium]